ncbi:hypothetical protein M5689_023363 [Euphorbia peplus]|nr:hypothetical protein M5689_023363 [Euphorbia peplus]
MPRSKKLVQFFANQRRNSLKYFSIRDCDGLEMICSSSLTSQAVLEHLEYMELLNLKNLGVLFRKERNAVAYGSCFSNLTRLLIQVCQSIKKLFPIQLLSKLKNICLGLSFIGGDICSRRRGGRRRQDE